ncbi:MAG: FhaA domain-containing protein [Actinomycetota bacterium]
MPILRDFERRLEGVVEGFFAKTFRSGLQPVELAKRVLREMDSGKTVGVKEVWAPNHFEIALSQIDRERFEQAELSLIAELKQVVREGAAERGWGLVGPPEVEFSTDEGLGKGEFHVTASLVEGEPEPARAQIGVARPARNRAFLAFEDTNGHKEFPLDKDTVTIGRLPASDITIADPGASRSHAEVRATDGGYELVDLGSTNGTMVNGRRVREQPLEDGDRITIGRTVIDFRAS